MEYIVIEKPEVETEEMQELPPMFVLYRDVSYTLAECGYNIDDIKKAATDFVRKFEEISSVYGDHAAEVLEGFYCSFIKQNNLPNNALKSALEMVKFLQTKMIDTEDVTVH